MGERQDLMGFLKRTLVLLLILLLLQGLVCNGGSFANDYAGDYMPSHNEDFGLSPPPLPNPTRRLLEY